MAKSNRNRVEDVLNLFVEGMMPFVIQEMKNRHKDGWEEKLREIMRENPATKSKADKENIPWDAALVITVIIREWQYLFGKKLGAGERAMIHELSDVRNKWAHQEPFNTDDTLRALDTTHRLLTSIAAADQAAKVDTVKQEVMRIRFGELTKKEEKKASKEALAGQPTGGLKPWREIVSPHPDVASGKFAQAEFAADLAQVLRGDATAEYGVPKEFFRRTFITEGLHGMLTGAIERLSGRGGDPVIELQTNFGGGKTHSMLALYHLFDKKVKAADLPGIDVLIKEVGVSELPKAERAVLVGTALSAGQERTKKDGTVIRTMWGEMAYQLFGKNGYRMVEECDKNGTSPGSDLLAELFDAAGPSLILIDEWVAYIRQTFETPGLPGGSFDANLTFAQALTEAAKSPKVLVVASLPQSQIEVGGEGGQKALDILQNTFTRVKSSWRPASQEESYEIVRRRLFEPMSAESYASRDAVINAFSNMYRQQSSEFPQGVKEADYTRKLELSYPVHPELFERLYSDWASLEEFQRTRGVLRLMAASIYSLWEGDDRSLMIMPAMIPMDDSAILSEITTKSGLSPTWTNVIERDVDGPNSLSRQIDRDNTNLGRYSASRRVARTIYIGSAPIRDAAKRGISDQRIKLGCAQPGENVPIFGDALRRLTDSATHLYIDGSRYWFSTQPSVTRMAQDRAIQQSNDDVLEEIKRRLKEERKRKGQFAAVHACPDSTSDVADDPECRLVILKPETPHRAKAADSAAMLAVEEMLQHRGNGPRINRNALVFLAADKTRLADLEQSVRMFLAWKSIYEERQALDLDNFQTNQAKTKTDESETTIQSRIPECYQWLIYPTQPNPSGPIVWQEKRLSGDGVLADRVSKWMSNEELLNSAYAGIRMRMDLDRIPLWQGNNGKHVGVKQLCEQVAQYLFLPRFTDESVVVRSLEDGLTLGTWRDETFAYADRFDADRGRYLGLKYGGPHTVRRDSESVIVHPEAAMAQIAADEEAERNRRRDESELPPAGKDGNTGSGGSATGGATPLIPVAKPPKRFYGTVKLDPTRLGRDAGRIAEEILAHLSSIQGAQCEVSLELEVHIPDGVPDNVVRTVTENCRTLKFSSQGFEAE